MSDGYFVLRPAMFRLDGGAMFGIIPRPLWSKKMPPDEMNRINLALNLLLIRKKDRIVLVDTGIGDDHDSKFNERFDVRFEHQSLEKQLKLLGIDAKDVTDVVLSHLHFDHVGGLFHYDKKEKEEIFTSARFHVHKGHYKYALAPTPRDQGSFHSHIFAPYLEEKDREKRVYWHSGESGELIPELGLSFIVSHGHTSFMMHPYDNKVFYLADLIPTSHHIPIPWVMGYDIHPGVTAEEKKKILDLICEKKLTVVYEHDPEFWGSLVVPSQKRSGEFESKQDYDFERSPLPIEWNKLSTL